MRIHSVLYIQRRGRTCPLRCRHRTTPLATCTSQKLAWTADPIRCSFCCARNAAPCGSGISAAIFQEGKRSVDAFAGSATCLLTLLRGSGARDAVNRLRLRLHDWSHVQNLGPRSPLALAREPGIGSFLFATTERPRWKPEQQVVYINKDLLLAASRSDQLCCFVCLATPLPRILCPKTSGQCICLHWHASSPAGGRLREPRGRDLSPRGDRSPIAGRCPSTYLLRASH
jgi:hypothetical protein